MDHCCSNKTQELALLKQRQATVLKIVLGINLGMFLVEFGVAWFIQSTALLADSLDMLGDALVYAFSLYVLDKGPRWVATSAFLKGVLIVAFGLAVLGKAASNFASQQLPDPEWMKLTGALALSANLSCLILLSRHRSDDLNMRSTWICSRNDIIANLGVIAAAVLVGITGSKWPDLLIGLTIAILFLRSAVPILKESTRQLRSQDS